MTGVAAVHHALGHVDAAAGDVGVGVDVVHAIDRAAVDPHAKRERGSVSERAADFEGAAQGRLRVAEKDERHAVAGRQTYQLLRGLRALELLRAADDVIELLKRARLPVHRQFRVADDVHEEDVRNVELGGIKRAG